MKSAIFLGKRRARGSPREQWPDADLCGTTNSNQKYQRKYGAISDWSSWWDLHPVTRTKFYDGIQHIRPQTYAWYRQLPGPDHPDYRPVWMFEMQGRTGGLDPTIPAAVRFPIEEVLDAFPPDRYFYTCQLDWMVGYHLLRGYHHLILTGHGVSRDLQHMVRHRGILHWITVARERGVQVTVVPPSWFIPPSPYGIASGGINWQ